MLKKGEATGLHYKPGRKKGIFTKCYSGGARNAH